MHRYDNSNGDRRSNEAQTQTGEALPSRSIFPSHFQPRNWLRPGHIVSLGSLTSCWAFRFGGMGTGSVSLSQDICNPNTLENSLSKFQASWHLQRLSPSLSAANQTENFLTKDIVRIMLAKVPSTRSTGLKPLLALPEAKSSLGQLNEGCCHFSNRQTLPRCLSTITHYDTGGVVSPGRSWRVSP